MNKNSIAWPELEKLLIALGDELERPATLVVIGSTVCMSLGQSERMTMDVDVWRKDSSFDLGALKKACAKVGIEFDPKGYDEPESAYLQMVEPGIVQLGVFESTTSIFKAGNLEVCRPPIENIIASKLVRGDARDFDDCAFLFRKCRVPVVKIKAAIESMDDDYSRELALENLDMFQLCFESLKQGSAKAKGPGCC